MDFLPLPPPASILMPPPRAPRPPRPPRSPPLPPLKPPRPADIREDSFLWLMARIPTGMHAAGPERIIELAEGQQDLRLWVYCQKRCDLAWTVNTGVSTQIQRTGQQPLQGFDVFVRIVQTAAAARYTHGSNVESMLEVCGKMPTTPRTGNSFLIQLGLT